MVKQTTKSIIPEDWEQKSFSECVEKTSIPRQIKIPQGQYQKAGEYPIVDQSADFIAGYTDDKSRLYSGQLPVIVFGDHTRIFKYVDFAFSLGADGTKLLCPKKYLNPRYFFYYLCGLSLESKGYNRHYKYLKEKLISFPGMLEQRKISHILLNIKNAIDQQEQIIAKTKELKRSLMHQLFTQGLCGEELKETEIGMMPDSWEAKEISNLVEKTKQRNPAQNPDSVIKYVDVSGISRDIYAIVDYKNYKGPNAPSRARKEVKMGDVIFATVRPTLKRIAIVTEFFNNELCSTAFCVLRTKKEMLSSRYLYYCLQRENFVEELGKLQRGASYPAVTDNDVKKQKIPIPEILEQEEIAALLHSADTKIGQAEDKRNIFQDLFKSLLQVLMTGQVRVNDIDFEGVSCE